MWILPLGSMSELRGNEWMHLKFDEINKFHANQMIIEWIRPAKLTQVHVLAYNYLFHGKCECGSYRYYVSLVKVCAWCFETSCISFVNRKLSINKNVILSYKNDFFVLHLACCKTSQNKSSWRIKIWQLVIGETFIAYKFFSQKQHNKIYALSKDNVCL